jgi:hypothetical protein
VALRSKGLLLFGLLSPFLFYLGYVLTKNVQDRRPILPPEQSFLEDAISFNGRKLPVQVPDSESYNPIEGEDYLLAFWVKFTRAPDISGRYSLIQKIAAEGESFRGYAFEISRDSTGIRPVISWYSGGAAEESVFRFTDLKFSPKVWMLYVFGVKEGRYLLARTLSIKNNKPIELLNLGAHDLDGFRDAANSSPLIFGSLRAGQFAGDFGPIMLITGKGVVEKIDPLITRIVETPNQAPNITDIGKLRLRVLPQAEDLATLSASRVEKDR